MSATQSLSGRILHPQGDGFVHGPGSARRELVGLLRQLGAQRPLLVTTPSVERSGLAVEVAGWIGEGLVGGDVPIFAGSREHTPEPVVLEAAAHARRVGADSLVSLGGSSVIDLTKGIALLLAEGDELGRLHLGAAQAADDGGAEPSPKLPHVAVPTTLSGAEFTGAAGITDPTSGEKRIYIHPGLAPRWVVLDAELARSTPATLWAATGMKVFSDAIEMLCSPRSSPLSAALAGGALGLLSGSLEEATADAEHLEARSRCLFAVGMTLPQLASVGLGLVAALRHQIGGGAGVPHGVASTIVLPHVLRWNRPAAEGPLTGAARAIGAGGPDELIGRIEAMTEALGLPRRLRDVGMERTLFDPIARHVLGDAVVRSNPRAVSSADDVLEVLDAAW